MSLDAGDLGEQKRDNAERETEKGESPSTDASPRSLLSAEGVQLQQDLRSTQSGFSNYASAGREAGSSVHWLPFCIGPALPTGD